MCFILFIDDYMRVGYVYLILQKFEILEYFRRFISKIENLLDLRVKTLRTDGWRGEQFREPCSEKEITRHLTIPTTP